MKRFPSLNPVLVKEMRGRMRGPRAYLFLTGTLALFAVVTYGLYRLVRFTVASSGAMSAGAEIGQSIFTGLVFLSTIVICVMAPSLTANAISGEYERKTFDLLLATPLSASSVLLGKLIASLSYVALILLAAVPLVSLAFVFGGVATTDTLLAFLLLFDFGLTFGVIGLFFSALFHRTAWAVGASYLVLALFVLGTIFAYAVISVTRGEQPAIWLLGLNPFSAMASALDHNVVPNGVPSGLIPSLTWAIGGARSNLHLAADKPLWQFTVGIYAWLTVVLYLLATQLIKPVQRFQPRPRWGIVGLFLAISIIAPAAVYGQLRPDRILDWVRWTLVAPGDLVLNGKFTEPLERDWKIVTQAERGDESGGQVAIVGDGSRPVVQFSRDGAQHGETGITQVISQTVPPDKVVVVHAVLRVQSSDLTVCGVIGSECPLMIKIAYVTAGGAEQEWVQGFYINQGDDLHFCGTCENKRAHILVPQGEWYTFDSFNLLQTMPSPSMLPHLIRSLTILASGHSYQVEVAEVGLLTREGHPLDLTGNDNSFAAPTPVPALPFRRGVIIQREFVVPAVPPVKIAPVVPLRLPTATPVMR
jgi:ABC-2 type transport system permease protein